MVGLEGTEMVLYFLPFFLGEALRSAVLLYFDNNFVGGLFVCGRESDEWLFSICFLTEGSTQRSLHRNSEGIDREFWLIED